ncbi:hypothetical protein EJB05_14701, partial [Eragrostis curvula]
KCGSEVPHDFHQRPIPVERRPLVRPKGKKGWETIVPGDHERIPAGILGLLCRRHFRGMVPLRDGGQEPALTWAHYKRVADVPDEDGRDFRTVADRVVGELWVTLVYIELVNTSRSLDIQGRSCDFGGPGRI